MLVLLKVGSRGCGAERAAQDLIGKNWFWTSEGSLVVTVQVQIWPQRPVQDERGPAISIVVLFSLLWGTGGGAGHPDMFKSKQGVLRSCNVDVISKPQQEAF